MSLLLTLGFAGILSGSLPALEGPDRPERAAAVDRLAALGPEGVAPLGEALKRVGWRGREGILEALARIGPASLNLLMQTARNHTRIDARRLAIRSLGRVGGPAARDSLLHLLDTPNRDLVLEALGRIGDPVVAPEVARFLNDEVADVRRRAVVALGKTAGAGGVDRIADALSDPHHGVRFAAAGALEAIGPPAAEALLHRADRTSGTERYLTIRTLGRLRYRPARGRLKRALKATDWALRAAAAEALGRLAEVACAAGLEEALQVETHPFVREQIRLSLKQVRGER